MFLKCSPSPPCCEPGYFCGPGPQCGLMLPSRYLASQLMSSSSPHLVCCTRHPGAFTCLDNIFRYCLLHPSGVGLQPASIRMISSVQTGTTAAFLPCFIRTKISPMSPPSSTKYQAISCHCIASMYWPGPHRSCFSSAGSSAPSSYQSIAYSFCARVEQPHPSHMPPGPRVSRPPCPSSFAGSVPLPKNSLISPLPSLEQMWMVSCSPQLLPSEKSNSDAQPPFMQLPSPIVGLVRVVYLQFTFEDFDTCPVFCSKIKILPIKLPWSVSNPFGFAAE
mmetsp:Transcript_17288/g.42978  ORF Transcript_17288/g.42978 Transcript_17288/m.42978 type:complete len:277 (-) Transcript_17288:875-1705(-)